MVKKPLHLSILLFLSLILINIVSQYLFASTEDYNNPNIINTIGTTNYIDLSYNSWVLREAFFAREFNTDLTGNGYFSECNEFQISKKRQAYQIIRNDHNTTYTIMVNLKANDLTYDFNKEGFVIQPDTVISYWENELVPEAMFRYTMVTPNSGNFYISESSGVLIVPQTEAESIRERIDSNGNGVYVSINVKIIQCQDSIGTSYYTSLKSRQVLLRCVSINNIHLGMYNDWSYTPKITVSEANSIRNAHGSINDYYRLGYRSVNEYLFYLRRHITDDTYNQLRNSSCSTNEYLWIRNNNLSISNYIYFKRNGIDTNNYQRLNTAGYSANDFLEFKRTRQLSIEQYIQLKQNGVTCDLYSQCIKINLYPPDIICLITNNESISNYMAYANISQISVAQYLTLIKNEISLDYFLDGFLKGLTYEHILILKTNNLDSDDFLRFKRYYHITIDEYIPLKKDNITYEFYSQGKSANLFDYQIILIKRYNGNFYDYNKYTEYPFGYTFEDYINSIKNNISDPRTYSANYGVSGKMRRYRKDKAPIFWITIESIIIPGLGGVLHAKKTFPDSDYSVGGCSLGTVTLLFYCLAYVKDGEDASVIYMTCGIISHFISILVPLVNGIKYNKDLKNKIFSYNNFEYIPICTAEHVGFFIKYKF